MFIAKLGEAITDTSGVPQAQAFLPSLISGAEASLYLDFADLTRMWKDSAGTDPVTADGDLIGKAASPYGAAYAFQSVAGTLGTYRTAGGGVWRGDGASTISTADWLDTFGFLFAASGGNTVSIKITPNAASAGRSFFGFQSSSRFQMSMSASGFLTGGYGTVGAAISGAVDVRATTFIATLTHDDENLSLYHNTTLLGTVAKAGAHQTTVGPAIGAAKIGTAAPTGGWTGCDIRKVLLLSGRPVTADEVAEIVTAFG